MAVKTRCANCAAGRHGRILTVGGGSMLQDQEVAAGLAHMADSICERCLMSQTCQGVPMCGDIQLLKQAEELLKKA